MTSEPKPKLTLKQRTEIRDRMMRERAEAREKAAKPLARLRKKVGF